MKTIGAMMYLMISGLVIAAISEYFPAFTGVAVGVAVLFPVFIFLLAVFHKKASYKSAMHHADDFAVACDDLKNKYS